MVVTSLRVPVIANAVELADYIKEARGGDRIYYDSSTSPTLKDINYRLMAAEDYVEDETKENWHSNKITEETRWNRYRQSASYRNRSNIYNKLRMPNKMSLMHGPVISVDKLELIISGDWLDIVADSGYTEGYDNDYFIDYRNSIIEWKNTIPGHLTPVRTTYTYGKKEDEYNPKGVIATGTIASMVSEISFTVTETELSGQFNGKLLKMTSGTAVGNTYRIYTNTFATGTNTYVVMAGNTIQTDGVLATDTYDIFAVPHNTRELVCIYTYMGMLIGDPTYQHNLTNPFEEANPMFTQIEMLRDRFFQLLRPNDSNIKLIM